MNFGLNILAHAKREKLQTRIGKSVFFCHFYSPSTVERKSLCVGQRICQNQCPIGHPPRRCAQRRHTNGQNTDSATHCTNSFVFVRSHDSRSTEHAENANTTTTRAEQQLENAKPNVSHVKATSTKRADRHHRVCTRAEKKRQQKSMPLCSALLRAVVSSKLFLALAVSRLIVCAVCAHSMVVAHVVPIQKAFAGVVFVAHLIACASTSGGC